MEKFLRESSFKKKEFGWMQLPLLKFWKKWNFMSKHVNKKFPKFKNTVYVILLKIDLMSPELWKYHPYPPVFKKSYQLSFSYFMVNSTTNDDFRELVVLLTKRKRSSIIVIWEFLYFSINNLYKTMKTLLYDHYLQIEIETVLVIIHINKEMAE